MYTALLPSMAKVGRLDAEFKLQNRVKQRRDERIAQRELTRLNDQKRLYEKRWLLEKQLIISEWKRLHLRTPSISGTRSQLYMPQSGVTRKGTSNGEASSRTSGNKITGHVLVPGRATQARAGEINLSRLCFRGDNTYDKEQRDHRRATYINALLAPRLQIAGEKGHKR